MGNNDITISSSSSLNTIIKNKLRNLEYKSGCRPISLDRMRAKEKWEEARERRKKVKEERGGVGEEEREEGVGMGVWRGRGKEGVGMGVWRRGKEEREGGEGRGRGREGRGRVVKEV